MTTHRALWVAAGLLVGLAPALSAQVELRAIFGTSPSDVWVVGEAPAALHWDGQAWNEMPFGVSRPGTLHGVWASGPRDVYAVGDGGAVLHFDGGSWSRMSVPTSQQLVAVAGRGAGDVYALAQSSNDREAPQLLHFDGRTWTATPLPLPFRANALTLAGRDVVVAGVVYYDPQPSERRQAGVVARWSGGRWATTGWDGQKVADPVAGAAGWTGLSAAGSTLLLFGQREDGTRAIAMSSGGSWTLLPPAASAMSRTQVRLVALAGDASPVALYEGDGFARYAGGRWTAVSGQAAMMQMMYGQPQPGATAEQQQQAAARQQQLMAQLQANPMMMALRMQAFDMSRAAAVWGTSAGDFYVVSEGGRIVHVVGDQATIAYDASCADPAAAANPICQALQAKQ
ncbi:MAG TPA: hypothetical protein VMF70_09085 [Gemmatimonadales bacterium]|nr:hypothetical protein [Gemmatimonadales bacterium]